MTKSRLRRHPLITIMVFLFFAVSLIMIIALRLSSNDSSPKKQQRKKVNEYLLPADFGLHREVVKPESPFVEPLIPASDAEVAVDYGLSDHMYKLISIVAAAVGIVIGIFVTQLLIN